MIVETTRFGRLEVAADRIVHFPGGLPGFERLRRFVLVPERDVPVFLWLQAVDAPEVALLVTDPFAFFPEYSVDLPDEEAAELGLRGPEEALVLTTVSIPGRDVGSATTNLLSPIVINVTLRRGRQVILAESRYGLKERLFRRAPDREAAAC
ncbi:MAG: flagellar assembly protein FliW [Firmicutes bacterium]|nr:flagellar assembly protein FliW [Bacillota bacterium]